MSLEPSVDWLGWAGSLILLVTLASQIHRQWRAETTEGVSAWLFVGQSLASATFFAYSYAIDNRVFMFTNGLLIVAAVIGQCVFLYRRRRERTRLA